MDTRPIPNNTNENGINVRVKWGTPLEKEWRHSGERPLNGDVTKMTNSGDFPNGDSEVSQPQNGRDAR